MNSTSDTPLQYFGRDLEAMSFALNYHKWVIEEFTPYLGYKVAEVGAGVGNFSNLLLDTSIRHLVAFEPSENMYPILENRLRNSDKAETVNAYFRETSVHYRNGVDSILYVNVLEHIKEDKEELMDVYQTLREKGHVLIFVPALSWLYSDFDESVGHFRRYHKNELVSLVRNAGFSIIKVKYLDFFGIVPWYLSFVKGKKSLTAENVNAYDRFVIPMMRILEGMIPPPIGKNLLLVAQKEEYS